MLNKSKTTLELRVLLVFLLGFVGFFLFEKTKHLLEPVPYRVTDVVRSEIKDGEYYLVANFVKEENCVIQRLTVVAFAGGVTRLLPWEDLDGLPQYQDREIGVVHTLRIRGDTQGLPVEKIEVRTRHLCEDRTLDKVFVSHQLEATNEE